MKVILKTKYLFARLVSFLLLLFSAGGIKAQQIEIRNPTVYGVMPPEGGKVGMIVNFFIWIAIPIGTIIALLIGYRWFFKRGSNNKLVDILIWIVIAIVILVLLSLVLSSISG